MSLKASCDALYFPDIPRDNLIDLQWEGDSNEPLESHSLLVFKAKCTAPQLFHVLPRYGAIPLTNATGATLPGAATVTFGLRERNVETKDSHTATPDNSRKKYQERFALEYLVIHSELTAYQQVSQAIGDHLHLSDVVKSIWSKVTSRTIPSSHVRYKGSVNLKVYMQNVVMSGESVSPNSVVVPSTAQLVPPSLQEKLGSSRSPNSATHYSPTASSQRGSIGGFTGNVENELRALRDEITTLKETVETPNRSGSGSVAANSPTFPSTTFNFEAADSAIMAWPFSTSAGKKKSKKGIPLTRLLILMFVFYIVSVLLFRSSKTNLEVGNPSSPPPPTPTPTASGNREEKQNGIETEDASL